MKLLSFLIALLIIPTSCSAGPKPYDHNPNSIVQVVCMDDGGKSGWFGSATRIAPHTYVSVTHVTSEHNCKVNGTAITVTYTNVEQDFSVFTGPEGTAFLPVSCKGFKKGKAYVMRGYAGGGTDDFFQPVIFTMYDLQTHLALFVGNDFPGMSGGPIIDSRGRITGTVNISDPTGGVDLRDTILCRRK